MTTIAFKDGVLASDSLATSNGVRESMMLKVRKVGKVLVAGAGSGAMCERFVDWVRKGMEGDSPWQGSDEGNSLVASPDGTIIVWGANGPWRVTRPYYALGSGTEIALGAMAAGASAVEAVKIAIELDVHSGGPVRTVTF